MHDLLGSTNVVQFFPILLNFSEKIIEDISKEIQIMPNEKIGIGNDFVSKDLANIGVQSVEDGINNISSIISKIKLRDRITSYFILAIHAYIDVYATELSQVLIEKGPLKLRWALSKRFMQYQTPTKRIEIIFAQYKKEGLDNPLKDKLDEMKKQNVEIGIGKKTLEKLKDLRNIIAHNEPLTGEKSVNKHFVHLKSVVQQRIDKMRKQEDSNQNNVKTRSIMDSTAIDMNLLINLDTITRSISTYLVAIDSIIAEITKK